MSVPKILWKDDVEEHDYVAADEYMKLLFWRSNRKQTLKNLRQVKIETFYAKDVLRASGLPALNALNVHVRSDVAKVGKREKLSPILLGKLFNELVILDGYHRVCAVHSLSENERIPCRLAVIE
jgi:hypothetical protein